jgi:hypothetical protein
MKATQDGKGKLQDYRFLICSLKKGITLQAKPAQTTQLQLQAQLILTGSLTVNLVAQI